jgi:hypothetical protein
MEQAFLPMLAAAGLTMALMDMRHAESLHCVRSCDMLLKDAVFTWNVPVGESEFASREKLFEFNYWPRLTD